MFKPTFDSSDDEDLEPEDEYNSKLIKSVKENNIEALKSLLKEVNNIEDLDMPLALHQAIVNGSNDNTEMVEFILKQGLDPNFTESGGMINPIDICVMEDKSNYFEILIKYGAAVGILLHQLCMIGKCDKKMFDLLYKHVDISSRDTEGFGCTHLAVLSGHLDGLKTLLSRGASVNESTFNNRWTPLHIVAKDYNLDNIDCLLWDIPEVVKNEENKTNTVKTLLSLGADINLSSASGKTPLEYAWQGKLTKTCELLIEEVAKLKNEKKHIEESIIDFIESNLEMRCHFQKSCQEFNKL